MFMPTIFHENLFDDFFGPFWNDGALERAMNRAQFFPARVAMMRI